jgi:hypothetical protein
MQMFQVLAGEFIACSVRFNTDVLQLSCYCGNCGFPHLPSRTVDWLTIPLLTTVKLRQPLSLWTRYRS